MTKSNLLFKLTLSLLCAISFSSVSLTSLKAFAEDDEMLETDFDMHEPNIVDEPSTGAPVAVPAPSEPIPPVAAPSVPAHKEIRKEKKKKHEAAVHKAEKKHAKVVKAVKKEKKAIKAKAKTEKKNKKKTKKT